MFQYDYNTKCVCAKHIYYMQRKGERGEGEERRGAQKEEKVMVRWIDEVNEKIRKELSAFQ